MKQTLTHYGVIGMKWGRRRGSSSKVSHPKAKDLNDKDLRDRINRLQMEKQYKQLTTKEKSTGRKMAEGLLIEVGKELVKDAIKSAIKNPVKRGK